MLDVSTLKALLRNYQGFRSLYEAYGVDTVTTPDGKYQYSLWDLEYLVDHGLPLLTRRQQEAIYLCYLMNVKEREAALMMGVSETNPVSMYGTKGLAKLLLFIEEGRLPCFRHDDVFLRTA